MCLLLILIGLVAYANSVFHPFVHDDLVFIRYNPFIADLSNLSFIFSKTAAASGSLTIVNPYYRPLIDLFYRIQYQLFYFNAHGYHFVNVLIHLFNGVLVFKLMQSFTRRKMISWCIAALFLIHPVQTEAVACIAGVSNLLYVLLFLSSFLLYLKSAKYRGGKKYAFYAGALFFYLVSLFIKEQAIVLPLVIILYEYCFKDPEAHPAKRISRASRFTPHVLGLIGGFILIAAGYLLWRKFFLGTAVAPLFNYKSELILRILAIPRTLIMYLRILLFPWDLHYYRSIDILDPPGIAAGVLVFIVAGIYLLVRRLPRDISSLLLFGAGWFLITIFPTLNIVPQIQEYSQIAAFEHFLYLPLAGGALFILVISGYVLDKWKIPAVKRALIIAIIFVCVGLTIGQNTYWRGEIPLFERVVKYEKRFSRAHILLGKAYYRNQEFDRAIGAFQTALKIMEGYVRKVAFPPARKFHQDFIKEIHFELALCYEAKGDYAESLNQNSQALQIDPKDAGVHNNMGLTYVRLRDFDKAIPHFKEVLSINPEDLPAMNNLAVCYIEKGDYRKAERFLREVLSIDSNFASARQNLEKLLKEAPASF